TVEIRKPAMRDEARSPGRRRCRKSTGRFEFRVSVFGFVNRMNKGVLLVNLGSPDSTSVGDVRRYLNEFLMDGRVIDTPWPLRRFIVGMILINRPKHSAHAYRMIWTKEGSPL